MGADQVFSGMQQADTVAEVQTYMKDLGVGDLAVFDVDMVLTQPDHPAFQMPNLLRHGKIYKETMGAFSPQEKDIAVSLLVTRGSSTYVDPSFLSLVSELKEKGVKVLALSAVVTGALDGVPSMEAWRKKELLRLGFDFSASFPEVKEFVFDEFAPYRNHYANYQEGVILSNGENNPVSKGELLKAFLKKISLRPKKIVFVDDRLENLTLAEAFFRENAPEIEFVTIHYVGAQSVVSPEVDETTFKKAIEKLKVSSMDYRTLEIPSKNIMGISCRTSNENPVEIGKLWERFSRENIFDKIPNKANFEVVALYCDYEGDHTKPYTLILGCEVTDTKTIPEGFVVKKLPKATYAVIPAYGEMPLSVIEAWQSIWKSSLHRTYTGDFEIYSSQGVKIFVAVKP